jgi:hypothetical protein
MANNEKCVSSVNLGAYLPVVKSFQDILCCLLILELAKLIAAIFWISLDKKKRNRLQHD